MASLNAAIDALRREMRREIRLTDKILARLERLHGDLKAAGGDRERALAAGHDKAFWRAHARWARIHDQMMELFHQLEVENAKFAGKTIALDIMLAQSRKPGG